MKNIKWIFVFFAVLATASIMGIGIAISEKSILIASISVGLSLLSMAMGIATKRKWRNEGKL